MEERNWLDDECISHLLEFSFIGLLSDLKYLRYLGSLRVLLFFFLPPVFKSLKIIGRGSIQDISITVSRTPYISQGTTRRNAHF